MSKFQFLIIVIFALSAVNCYDRHCQSLYNNKMLELHNNHRAHEKGLYPLRIDHSMTRDAFLVIDAKINKNTNFFKTNPYFWNIFGQKLSNFNVSCTDHAIVDYKDKILSGKNHFMNSNTMLYMSCAARFEHFHTTTACVYYDKPKVCKNGKRVWVTKDPKHPNWQAIYTEINDDFWKQTENGTLVGVWRNLEEPNLNVVVLGNLKSVSKSWRNPKLTYTLTDGAAFVNNRLNAIGVDEYMGVRGTWF
jgi:hypothetical protein